LLTWLDRGPIHRHAVPIIGGWNITRRVEGNITRDGHWWISRHVTGRIAGEVKRRIFGVGSWSNDWCIIARYNCFNHDPLLSDEKYG